MKYFCYLGCSILTAEVAAEIPYLDSLVDLKFVPAGFHEQPEVLKKIIQQQIDEIEEWNELKAKSPTSNKTYDAILLGLGLCDNATAGLHSQAIPMVIPRAHDCITLLLGSKESYREYFNKIPENYWYSSGWIKRMLQPGPERTAELQRIYHERYGEENSHYLLQSEADWQRKYQQATFIDWELPDNQKCREYTKECAAYLNWSYHEVKGNKRLLRDFLNGNWDEDRFLVIQPGEEIAPSFEESIVCAVKRK